jgi:putative Holliday junction resolvase
MMIVAIDVGLKRIGVAISPDKKVSLPQPAIIRKGRRQASAEVSNLLKELEAKILVVGIPLGGSTEDEMSRRIRHFVSLIDTENVEVYFQDEAGSSFEAKEMTKGVIKQKRDGKIDSIAASLILQRWLDSQDS